jgi:hypothetical protein
MRCRCDANALLSLALPAKSRSIQRVWKSIFSLLESFSLLPQKRNFRFLFLNQCKLYTQPIRF